MPVAFESCILNCPEKEPVCVKFKIIELPAPLQKGPKDWGEVVVIEDLSPMQKYLEEVIPVLDVIVEPLTVPPMPVLE